MTGLYDSEGVLRFAGRDQGDCLAYAQLFDLDADSYSLASLACGLTAVSRPGEPRRGP
ncbi:MAG: hypothetical protein WD136_09070 [Cyanobium sp.]